MPGLVLRKQRIPFGAPHDLHNIPAGATECGLKLLDDLAIATYRAIEALQVAVDDEDEIVQAFAHRHRNRAHRLRLVHLPIAKERPDLAVSRFDHPAMLHVAHEAGLVDGHHRAEAH